MSNDIGDAITIELTVVDTAGDPTNATSATIVVTAPDGTTSNPTPTNPTTGTYQAVVVVTQAGQWSYKWTTTGPAGVEHGQFTVDPDPPARVEPLVTVADLEARIGTLTDAQRARVDGLLADASALVRSEARQTFQLVTNDVAVLRVNGRHIRLPERPVVSVASVVAVGTGIVDDLTLPAGAWAWDGLDKIQVVNSIDWIINLPADWDSGYNGGAGTYRVTYTHGYATVPADVQAVVVGMVNRTLTSPSMVSGLTQETIGQYSYQLQQGTGSVGSGVRLTAEDRQILRRYRRTMGTSETPVR